APGGVARGGRGRLRGLFGRTARGDGAEDDAEDGDHGDRVHDDLPDITGAHGSSFFHGESANPGVPGAGPQAPPRESARTGVPQPGPGGVPGRTRTRGHRSPGFRTTVLPVAGAAPIGPAATATGSFHGVRTATT